MVGPGVVPRHSNFKNLDCQTAPSAMMGAKGFLAKCQIVSLQVAIAAHLIGLNGFSIARERYLEVSSLTSWTRLHLLMTPNAFHFPSAAR